MIVVGLAGSFATVIIPDDHLESQRIMFEVLEIVVNLGFGYGLVSYNAYYLMKQNQNCHYNKESCTEIF